MDTIFVEGLLIATRIGINPGERDAPQTLLLDLELGVDNRTPAASGRIEDTPDYAVIAAAIRAFAAASNRGLLEEFAEACCAMLQQHFAGIRNLDLRVDKPAAAAALGCQHVGVRIQRQFT